MTEGLRFQFTSAEMVEMFTASAQRHEDNAATYDRRAELIQEDIDRDDIAAGGSNSAPRTYASRAKMERSQAANDRFAAAHIIPDEVYRLTENDLYRFQDS